MKKISFLFLLILAIIKLQAQDYLISFIGTGASTKVDSVKVENLTQGKSITIGGSEALHLVKKMTGINNLLLDYENAFRIYPNPMTDYSTIDFVATAPGTATIELFGINGKRVGKTQSSLTIGAHSFNVSGLCRGIYSVKINSNAYTYTSKLISDGEPCSAVKINYNGYSDIQVTTPKLKSVNVEKAMQYTTGDRLKITGKSSNYSTVIIDVPTQTKTITFTFVACTDADGNNYPVVQIFKQLWMAENLKTTKYRNGDPIPNVTDTKEWINLNLSTGAYCDYDNTPGNGTIYGKLYNWSAVNDSRNIAPTGWHVPTTAEWYTLESYMAANPGASGSVAKALASTTNWDSFTDNRLWLTGAIGNELTKNNSAGFTALPGGRRYTGDGTFDGIGKYCYWWSATEFNPGHAFGRSLGYYGSEFSSKYGYYKAYGFSVRLVRD